MLPTGAQNAYNRLVPSAGEYGALANVIGNYQQSNPGNKVTAFWLGFDNHLDAYTNYLGNFFGIPGR